MKTEFYNFSQNNSGGSFTVNDKLCNNVVIEATSAEEANDIAENLGIYFNGCNTGNDCSCCGDRWYPRNESDKIDIDEINTKWNGSEVSNYDVKKLDKLNAIYKDFEFTEPLKVVNNAIKGKVKLRNIEEYFQVQANRYGWTKPDVRIFYKNGTIKEIFSNKI